MREHFHRIWNKFTSLKSNLQVLEEWTADIAILGKVHQEVMERAKRDETLPASLTADELNRVKALDMEFIAEDLPSLVQESVKCLEILRADMMSVHRYIDDSLSVSLSTSAAPNDKGSK